MKPFRIIQMIKVKSKSHLNKVWSSHFCLLDVYNFNKKNVCPGENCHDCRLQLQTRKHFRNQRKKSNRVHMYTWSIKWEGSEMNMEMVECWQVVDIYTELVCWNSILLHYSFLWNKEWCFTYKKNLNLK